MEATISMRNRLKCDRYLDDFRRGISVFAIFSYGIAVLGTPQCPLFIIYMSCLTAKCLDLSLFKIDYSTRNPILLLSIQSGVRLIEVILITSIKLY